MVNGACHHLRGHTELGAKLYFISFSFPSFSRLTAEDMDQLQASISTCLQELFLLIQSIRHILPPFLFFLTPRV